MKKDMGHTAAIGLTVSITHLIVLTARFRVFIVLMVPIAFSARSRVVHDFSVWLAAIGGSGVPLSMDWTIGPVAPSVTRLSTGGFGVLVVTVGEEHALADTDIVKTVSVGCLGCPSALPKTISSSTCRVLSQTNQDVVHRLSPSFQ
jgi:hypothetical protein